MTAASKPRNKHPIIGQKRPLKISHIWGIRIRLEIEDNKRDLALFNLALDSKLRGSDLVKLLVSDVMSGGVVMRRALVTQQKTGSPVQFEITEGTRKSVLDWINFKGLNYSSYLFPSAKVLGEHICIRQYNRIFHSWIEKLGLDRTLYSTHTMRRTKAYLIYKKTKNLRVVQLLLGHKKLESTVRYLGIEVDDALDIAESLDI